VSDRFDIEQIQGNILRGYRRQHVRHLFLAISDRGKARKWLGAAASGGADGIPAITRESKQKWEGRKPDLCFNIGLTFEGLRELRIPEAYVKTLSAEFIQGMRARAVKLGDVDDSAPEHWRPEFGEPNRLHMLASIHADHPSHLDDAEARLLKPGGPFDLVDKLDGESLPQGKVHFNYTDNISQPRFREVPDHARRGDTEPFDPLGTILLGHPTTFEGLYWRDLKEDDLLFNGTFNAFRMMKQDVEGFEAFLDEAADWLLAHPDGEELLAPGAEADFHDLIEPDDKSGAKTITRHQAMREIVVAQMCGRWRNGRALALSPDSPGGERDAKDNTFEYPRDTRCPAGSHVRRCHPRGGQIVQRVANYSRRLIRRGMVYGPAYSRGDPPAERGLLGNFIGASLGAQFEAMMCDWLNLGLHDPDITGSNDPLIGANSPETSWFDLQLKSGKTIRLRGFKRFVTTRAGAYLFLPSLNAIENISKWTESG